ncbi:MAG: OmpA family protein [Bradymonadia bacterium]
MKLNTLLCAGTTLMCAGMCTTASAEPHKDRSPSVYLGASAGGNLVLSDWATQEVDEDTGLFVTSDSGFIARGRLGFRLADPVSLELSGAYLPTSADGDSHNVFAYTADLLIHLGDGDFRPFIVVGGGALHNTGDGDDIDPEGHYGLGARWRMSDSFLLRGEVRHVLTDGLTPDGPELANLLELTLGFDFEIWGADVQEPPAPPSDKDGDGIVDAEDSCPDVKGDAKFKGCPDSDGDGITDAEDACPQTSGLAEMKGCPDKDGDGITDADDACPEVKGDAKFKGCADTDGDDIPDPDDRCPEAKGETKFKGCPDGDGDGVADVDDLCPKRPGEVVRKGCPAPPKKVQEKFSGSIKGILFKTGSADLSDKSNKTLDEAAEVLKTYPNLKLRIEGHTDSKGNDEKNLKLSQDRANSVRGALMSRGVPAARLQAVGLGETQPKASNKTRKGRAQNRRIEFKIQQ